MPEYNYYYTLCYNQIKVRAIQRVKGNIFDCINLIGQDNFLGCHGTDGTIYISHPARLKPLECKYNQWIVVEDENIYKYKGENILRKKEINVYCNDVFTKMFKKIESEGEIQ